MKDGADDPQHNRTGRDVMMQTMTDAEIARAKDARRAMHAGMTDADQSKLDQIISRLRHADDPTTLTHLVRDYVNGVLPKDLEP